MIDAYRTYVLVAPQCGHGTSIDGTWDCGCTYGKYTEADLMLKITKAVNGYLRGSGIHCLTDADHGNNRNMIADVRRANNHKPQPAIYFSIHCDWYKASSGVSTLYVSKAGRELAVEINKQICKRVGIKCKGVSKRPDLYELTQTDMPAVIIECGSIKYDRKYFKHYKKYGKAIAIAVCKYLGVTFTGKYKA